MLGVDFIVVGSVEGVGILDNDIYDDVFFEDVYWVVVVGVLKCCRWWGIDVVVFDRGVGWWSGVNYFFDFVF